MSEKPMTREECENTILDLLEQIGETYRRYNPDGKILCMSWTDDNISVFNGYWDAKPDEPAGEDHDKPINAYRWLKGSETDEAQPEDEEREGAETQPEDSDQEGAGQDAT